MFTYPMSDIYPRGLYYADTSNSVSVGDESAEALQEDRTTVDAAHQKARSIPILLALGVLIALAVFFGID